MPTFWVNYVNVKVASVQAGDDICHSLVEVSYPGCNNRFEVLAPVGFLLEALGIVGIMIIVTALASIPNCPFGLVLATHECGLYSTANGGMFFKVPYGFARAFAGFTNSGNKISSQQPPPNLQQLRELLISEAQWEQFIQPLLLDSSYLKWSASHPCK